MSEIPTPFQNQFNSDGEAIQFLESRKYLCQEGVIIPPGPSFTSRPDEQRAINYLVEEWDYAYSGL